MAINQFNAIFENFLKTNSDSEFSNNNTTKVTKPESSLISEFCSDNNPRKRFKPNIECFRKAKDSESNQDNNKIRSRVSDPSSNITIRSELMPMQLCSKRLPPSNPKPSYFTTKDTDSNKRYLFIQLTLFFSQILIGFTGFTNYKIIFW